MAATLPPFNPATALRPGSVCLVIGHQGAGKSRLICDLIQHTDASAGLLVNGLPDSYRNAYTPIEDRVDLVLGEFRESAVIEIVRRQRGAHEHAIHTFVVLDDCIYDVRIFTTLPIGSILRLGRTHRTSLFVAQTYAMGLPPFIRTNIDYVFVFRESMRSNVRRIYSQYVADADRYSLGDMEAMIRLPRSDYDCLVIDYGNTGQIYRYRVCSERVPRPLSFSADLEEFDPVTAFRPGDLCAFTGAGRSTPIFCDLLARLPDLSAGYLVMHEDALPPYRDYLSLKGRVRIAVRHFLHGYSLAQHLLDLSGQTLNSFVILEDNCIYHRNVALDYLEANRRELGITVFSSKHYMPVDRPDLLFVAYPHSDRSHDLRLIYENMGIADCISFHDFRDLVYSLDYLRYECIVVDRRAGRLFLYKPRKTWS
jgi:hypothetical protein